MIEVCRPEREKKVVRLLQQHMHIRMKQMLLGKCEKNSESEGTSPHPARACCICRFWPRASPSSRGRAHQQMHDAVQTQNFSRQFGTASRYHNLKSFQIQMYVQRIFFARNDRYGQ